MKAYTLAAAAAAAAVIGLGIVTAAPAGAAPPTLVCDETHACNIVQQTVVGYRDAVPATVQNYRNLPGDTALGYADAAHDTIRNYTGVSVGTDPNPDT